MGGGSGGATGTDAGAAAVGVMETGEGSCTTIKPRVACLAKSWRREPTLAERSPRVVTPGFPRCCACFCSE